MTVVGQVEEGDGDEEDPSRGVQGVGAGAAGRGHGVADDGALGSRHRNNIWSTQNIFTFDVIEICK